MKKVLMTLVAVLAISFAGFAQDTHWPEFNLYAFPNNLPVVGFVQVNGEYVTTANYADMEVAAFVNGECRGHMFMDDYTGDGDPYPIFEMSVYFDNGESNLITFQLYDHSTGVLYEECTANMDIVTGEEHVELYFDYDEAVVLSFTGSAGPATVPWGNEWIEVPDIDDDVTIGDDIVVIESGVTAYANSITFTGNGQIIIEEGGQLYHNDEVEVTMQLDVVGYDGGSKDGENAGYRLFGCPVHSTLSNNFIPVEGTNLNTGTFDLYKFDESQDLEWRNFEAGEFENLDLGTGYLYANAASVDNAVLRGFTVTTGENYDVSPLQFTAGTDYAGWNLVGNPYTCNAYVKNGSGYMPYYVLNTNGDGIDGTVVAAGTPIAPMKGLFVKASATDQYCTFTTEAPSAKGSLNIMVNQGRGMVDNAILSFGEGSNLEKLQFNPNHTKVYMTQDGEDYAVVSAPEMGEMPVSFRAESNGTYTLGFTAEEVSFGYLHLIDNMTGADVDLLATPSYTFSAQTTDYANRFKLVFATGSNSNEDGFAFFSNGSFVISNEGEATLQVIDINGRILSSESINGCASVSVDAAAGVYMLRLVNGENVKVQKVVVR